MCARPCKVSCPKLVARFHPLLFTMSATSTTTGAADDDSVRQSPSEDFADNNSPSTSYMEVPFSAGNPRIEETRGVMILIPEDISSSSPSKLPDWRKPLLCVLEVPNHMTYSDFCMFCASFISQVLEMRVVRNEKVEDSYSVLLTFVDQDSTDEFYRHFNRKQFSSIEEKICHVFFTADVRYTSSIEHPQASVAKPTEPASCPVCLEKLDGDTDGILTTICNHSFHCSCISKWADSSCPVCRYCQERTSTCSVCQTSVNLWMCVVCGFVGCGRYKEGHAIRHWKDTQHCYSVELETKRVWDYVGDNYVHRLILSKTDGKLVEVNSDCTQGEDNLRCCERSTDDDINGTHLDNKVEQIIDEHNMLLHSHLESKKEEYESRLQAITEETELQIAKAIQKADCPKLQKMQAKLNKCIEEKNFILDLHDNLVKNRELWKAKIEEAEYREQVRVRFADEKIQALEEQLRILLAMIEDGVGPDTQPSTANSKEMEIRFSIPPTEPSSAGSNRGNRRSQRNRKRS